MPPSPPAPTQLPLPQVRFERGFLADRARLVRDTVIPYQWEALNDRVSGAERSGTVHNFEVAAKQKEGEFHGLWFQDSDLAKWIEAASFRLATHPDPALDAALDGIIATIAKAQQPDGYLDTYIQLVEPDKRWANLHEYHELYIAGHFIEAGVAHFQATGKRSLLEVVCKLADLLDWSFGTGPGQIPGYCGHEEIELALLKLARTTGEGRYTRLAERFLELRGQAPIYYEAEIERLGIKKLPVYFYHDRWAYLQAHRPIREQTEPVGHSVRAMYLYTAMADLARTLGDEGLANTCRSLWEQIRDHHLYLTGGIGSEWMGEKFSERYDLPNDRAYAESCAGIGLALFSRRMLDLDLRGDYGDVIERALYNNVSAGMSLDGTRFFYVNPLEVTPSVAKRRYDCHYVKTQRVGWFGCACCPPNIARTFASLGHYAYSHLPDGLAVHLYAEGSVEWSAGAAPVRLKVATDYPWDERVCLTVECGSALRFILRLRIPGWCVAPRMTVAGRAVDVASVDVRGYARIDREWQSGEEVVVEFPMPIDRVRAHPYVTQNAGCVAIQRGPIVYCAEEIDNGARLGSLRLPRDTALAMRFDEQLLGGAVVIEGKAERLIPAGGDLYTTRAPTAEPAPLTLIPYCLWNNRGEGEMKIWIHET